jgi:hypothetical protein
MVMLWCNFVLRKKTGDTMKISATTLFVLTFFFVISSFASQKINGVWKWPSQVEDPVTHVSSVATLTFTDGSLTWNESCTLGGHTVVVETTAPVSISRGELVILEASEREAYEHGINCQANLPQIKMNFSISEDNRNLLFFGHNSSGQDWSTSLSRSQ